MLRIRSARAPFAAFSSITHLYLLSLSGPGVCVHLSLSDKLGGERNILVCGPCVVESMTQHMGMMMDFSDEDEQDEESNTAVMGHLQLLPPYNSKLGWLYKEFTDGTAEYHTPYPAIPA